MEHYEIFVYDSAKQDIRDAIGYISKILREPETAHNMLSRFQEEIFSLADMPERYPIVSDCYLASLGFRVTSVGNYLIFYIVKKELNHVDIIRVLYGKRNWIDLLRNDI